MTPGLTYAFETKAPLVLGASHVNMSLFAIGVYAMALSFEPRIPNIHTTIRSENPDITQEDVSRELYYVFIAPSGEKQVFNAKWINWSTIQASTSTITTIHIQSENVGGALAVLEAAGYPYSLVQ